MGIVTITDSNFEAEVLHSDKLVMVDFWATWCGPCKTLSPTIDKLSIDYADKLKIGKVDVDENSNTSENMVIRSVPTIMFFKNGDIVGQISGATSEKVLKDSIDKLIAKNGN